MPFSMDAQPLTTSRVSRVRRQTGLILPLIDESLLFYGLSGHAPLLSHRAECRRSLAHLRLWMQAALTHCHYQHSAVVDAWSA